MFGNNLLEDPTPIIFLGIVVEAVLGVILLRTGRGVLLLAMGGVLAFVLAGVALEWIVVTEFERVEATLDGAAAALEANDPERIFSYISPSATRSRARANEAVSRFEVTKVRIRNLRIKVNKLTSPPSAKATFDGFVWLNDRRGELLHHTYAGRLTVEFRLEGDRWLITGHTENAPDRRP